MRYPSHFIAGLLLAFMACHNLDDAPLSQRNTFIYIHEGPLSIVATDIEVIDGGYAVLGNMQVTSDSIVTVAFKTDNYGRRTTDFKYFPGGTGNAFVHFSNGNRSGYIIIGDSIKTDPASSIVANIDVASARVIITKDDLDDQPGTYFSRSHSDTTTHDANPYIADYYGETITTRSDGGVIILGTYREGVPNQQEVPLKPFILSLQPTLAKDWIATYDLIDRNYHNSKSIYYYNDKIYWATSIERVQGEFTYSYVSIPVIEDKSVFVNNSLLGESTDQLFDAIDVCPASNPAFGFGVVGTYSVNPDGSQSNMFFLRTNADGTIIQSSVRYFDAVETFTGETVASDGGQAIDHGAAITSTSDGGFVIAGTFDSNALIGNGDRDILLIKVNSTGNTVWSRRIGGSGDESVASIKETTDQGIIICATSTIGTYSTPILIKTDRNGELKN